MGGSNTKSQSASQGSLSVSDKPNRNDIRQIALAVASVLNFPVEQRKELETMDTKEICAWLNKNMPNIDEGKMITESPRQQAKLCQAIAVTIGTVNENACGGLADSIRNLAVHVKNAFDACLANAKDIAGRCSQPDAAKLQEVISHMEGVNGKILESKMAIIDSLLKTMANRVGSNPEEESQRLTAAFSMVPSLTEMIKDVCDATEEIENLCSKVTIIAVVGEVSGGCGCDVMMPTGGRVHGGLPTIESRIKTQGSKQKQILRDFRVKAQALFEEMLRAVYELGKRMGKNSVTLSDDLARFVNAFNELENVYSDGIEFALTGFYRHATAQEQRERFLGKLQSVLSTLNPLVSGSSNGDAFRAIQKPIAELQSHIDKYSDMFRVAREPDMQVKWGMDRSGGAGFMDRARNAAESLQQGLEDAPGALKRAAESGTKLAATVGTVAKQGAQATAQLQSDMKEAQRIATQGGNEDDDDMMSAGGALGLEKLGLTLKNVSKSLRHFYETAKWRENLKKVSSEAKQYNSKYEEIMGSALAGLIEEEKSQFKNFQLALEGKEFVSMKYKPKIPLAAAYGTIKDAVKNGPTDANSIARGWNKEIITTMELNSCNARIELYRALQAIDLYLMNFTDAITANPDDVKEMSKMLDSTEIVAEWFNDISGNYIAGLFEYMPWVIQNDEGYINGPEVKESPLGDRASGVAIIDDRESRLKEIKPHYYAKVNDAELKQNAHPGNPFLVISPQRAEYAREFAKKTVERMLALKNIVTTFAYMGNKMRASGGADGRVGWTPGQIYKALCTYLYTSAFAMGWDGYDANVAGNDPSRQAFALPYRPGSGVSMNTPTGAIFGKSTIRVKSSISDKKLLMGVLPYSTDGPSARWADILGDSLRKQGWSSAKTAYREEKLRNISHMIAAELEPVMNRIGDLKTAIDSTISGMGVSGKKQDELVEKVNSMIQAELPSAIAAGRNVEALLLRWETEDDSHILSDAQSKKQAAEDKFDVSSKTESDKTIRDNELKKIDDDTAKLREQVKARSASRREAWKSLDKLVIALHDERVKAQKKADEDAAKKAAAAQELAEKAQIQREHDETNVALTEAVTIRIEGHESKSDPMDAARKWIEAYDDVRVRDGLRGNTAEIERILQEANGISDDITAQNLGTEGNKIVRDLLLATMPYTAMLNAQPSDEAAGGKRHHRVSGGALFGASTMNWVDYCASIEPPASAKGNRGWLIAFDVSSSDAKNMKTPPVLAQCAFGCAMNSIEYKQPKVALSGEFDNRNQKTVGGWSCQFKGTDKLFIHAIKSMVAKVFTVSGLYNMVNFASPDDTFAGGVPVINTLSATRFIIGGGESGGVDTPASSLAPAMVPPIYDEAVELYIRLPLLAEFYRDIFSMTGRGFEDLLKKENETVVALVPEMDLSWSALMRLSFDNANSGAIMTKNYAARMVAEVNAIYERYKSRGPANLVSAVMNDFIADVNSRFGIMTRLETAKYRDMMKSTRRTLDNPRDDDLRDFDTLGEGDLSELGSGTLPSDRFSKTSTPLVSEERNAFKSSFIDALREFRETIDNKIRNVVYSKDVDYPTRQIAGTNFHEQARIVKNTLKTMTTPEQRFNTVFAAMTGVDNPQNLNDFAYVMFHEVILAPLSVLLGVYRAMKAFVDRTKTVTTEFLEGTSNHNDTFYSLMSLIISHVSSMSGLVDVDASGPKFVVDHSKLHQFCEDVLDFVRRNVQKFRGFVDRETIDRFESSGEGSIEWMQINLLDEMFDDRDMTQKGISFASGRIARCFYIMASGKDDLSDRNDDIEKADASALKIESLCEAIRKLIYYNPASMTYGTAFMAHGQASRVLTGNDKLRSLLMTRGDSKDRRVYDDILFASRWNIYVDRDSDLGFRGDRPERRSLDANDADRKDPHISNGEEGLMMKFNEILARYLEQFWDPSNGKIYQPLIDGFGNGVAHSAVIESNGWPDVCMPQGTASGAIAELANNWTGASEPYKQGWAANIAKQLSDDDKTNPTPISVDVGVDPNTFNELIGGAPDDASKKIAKASLEEVINDLNHVSTNASVGQIVNIVRHVFDRASVGVRIMMLSANPGHEPDMSIINNMLTHYRDLIIEKTGEHWVRFGPIATIAAACYALTPPVGDPVTLYDFKAVMAPAQEYYSVTSDPPRGDEVWGNPDEVVFASLGKIMRTMLTEQEKPGGVPSFLASSLTDFTSTTRMKENMRANLPIFKKMFGMIAVSCDVIRKALSIGIVVAGPVLGSGNMGNGVHAKHAGVHGQVFGQGYVNNMDRMDNHPNALKYFTRLLDKLTSSCQGINKCADLALGELNDNPLYLETHENSISDYRTMTNMMPFMPPSTMLMGLQPNETGKRNPRSMFPVHLPGARDFEFNYGTRLMLGQPSVVVMLDHAPGMREITENYNKTMPNDKHITLENVNAFLAKYVQLSRWLMDLRVFAPIISSDTMASYWSLQAAGANPKNVPYQLELTMDGALDLTTSSDKKHSLSAVAMHVAGKTGGGAVTKREDVQIYNILDMNLNPVNINALRREVPLVNMLNYSFTFDAFVKNIIGHYPPDNDPVDARGMFVKLALHPHMQKDDTQMTYRKIYDCYSDESASLGFGGHDRFAQDQVMNKALLAAEYQRKTSGVKRHLGTREHRGEYAYASGPDVAGKHRDNYTTLNMNGQTNYLRLLGLMRHDTTFIRNILFISTAHRLMRMRMSDEMMRITFPVVSGPPVAAQHITDESLWETYDDLRQV